ncbi:MAG TPA: response regulator [Polyangia bacterium]|jgi:CheY-like chemotaxis protein
MHGHTFLPHRGSSTTARDRRRAKHGPGRILVIDDEELIGKTIAYGLGAHYEVVTVTRAAAALRLCADGADFDLILCDLLMPDMTGMELYRRLCVAAPALVPRIVFLTGADFDPEVRGFLQDVPNPCLEKPFDFSSLVALVRERVGPPAARARHPNI